MKIKANNIFLLKLRLQIFTFIVITKIIRFFLIIILFLKVLKFYKNGFDDI